MFWVDIYVSQRYPPALRKFKSLQLLNTKPLQVTRMLVAISLSSSLSNTLHKNSPVDSCSRQIFTLPFLSSTFSCPGLFLFPAIFCLFASTKTWHLGQSCQGGERACVGNLSIYVVPKKSQVCFRSNLSALILLYSTTTTRQLGFLFVSSSSLEKMVKMCPISWCIQTEGNKSFVLFISSLYGKTTKVCYGHIAFWIPL